MTQLVGIPPAGPGSWGTIGGSSGSGRSWWRDAPARTRTTVQLTVLFAAVAAGYGYSLVTLLQNAEMQTPLAYISLVPIIALVLAAVSARPERVEPAIHDRQLDYIVGVPLIAAAVAIDLLLPRKLSAMFWVWRIDLLSLPLFVAGLVAILFGVRVLWRQKFAVGYLILAWPWPYSTVLLRALDASTSATLAGLRVILHAVPVAKPVLSSDGSLFDVVHDGKAFPVSVVSACSGINGIVGFLLVGVAFAAVVRGPWVRKIAWLAAGMLFLWIINLSRLVFIFWAGRTWGEHVAIGILHPVVGMVTFSVGIVIMTMAVRPMGMTIGRTGTAPASAKPALAGTITADKESPAVPKVLVAVALVALSTVVVGLADYGLRSYNLVANAAGEPKLLAFRAAPVSPQGWKYRISNQFDWAKPLFGDDSTWFRYTFVSSGASGDLHSTYGVTADVVDTSSLQTFSAYGVEACYQFHGFALEDVAQVAIGGGITGQTLSFTGSGHQSWSVVYWIVPVRAGQTVRYERFVLYLLDAPGGTDDVQLPRGVRITNLAGSLDRTGPDVVLARNRAFLVTFAHELIMSQASDTPTRLVHMAVDAGTMRGTTTWASDPVFAAPRRLVLTSSPPLPEG